MLGRILYVSQAAPDIENSDIYQIIRTAHRHNETVCLSGALIYLDGWFAQVLEGPFEDLSDRFAMISRDPRHREIALRIQEPTLRPLFAECRMALRTQCHLDADFLATFGYRPGFPVDIFPSDILLEFILRACTYHRDRQAGCSL